MSQVSRIPPYKRECDLCTVWNLQAQVHLCLYMTQYSKNCKVRSRSAIERLHIHPPTTNGVKYEF